MAYIINPAAKNIGFQIIVEIQQLEEMGWYFYEYHENTANALGILLDEAKKYNYEKYSVEVCLYGDATNVKTKYTWYKWSRNNCIDWKPTEDDAQTIEDVISFLRNEQFVSFNDESTNEAGEYVPTFVEA